MIVFDDLDRARRSRSTTRASSSATPRPMALRAAVSATAPATCGRRTRHHRGAGASKRSTSSTASNRRTPQSDGRAGLASCRSSRLRARAERGCEATPAPVDGTIGRGREPSVGSIWRGRRGRHARSDVVIPFVDLQAQYQSIKAEIDAAVLEPARQHAVRARAARWRRSRSAFAAVLPAEHAIGVNSGTSALHLALLAAGVGRGDEVITDAVHVHRHRRRRSTTPARRRCSSTSIRTVHDRPGPIEARDHAADQGDPAGAPLRAAGRHGPDHGDRRAPRARGDRGRRPGARRGVQGPAGRQHRRPRAASASIRARTSAPTARAARSRPNDDDVRPHVRMLRDWGAEQRYHHD